MPFDEIQQAVLDGKAEAGLLIHEGQLTYPGRGPAEDRRPRRMVAERTGGLPLPLGGNIIRRDLGPEMIAKVSKMLHDSIDARGSIFSRARCCLAEQILANADSRLLVLLQEAFHHREEIGAAALLRLFRRQPIQPFLHGFAFALNVDTPAGKFGRQDGHFALLCQSQGSIDGPARRRWRS